jgi:hypothetical protein
VPFGLSEIILGILFALFVPAVRTALRLSVDHSTCGACCWGSPRPASRVSMTTPWSDVARDVRDPMLRRRLGRVLSSLRCTCGSPILRHSCDMHMRHGSHVRHVAVPCDPGTLLDVALTSQCHSLVMGTSHGAFDG